MWKIYQYSYFILSNTKQTGGNIKVKMTRVNLSIMIRYAPNILWKLQKRNQVEDDIIECKSHICPDGGILAVLHFAYWLAKNQETNDIVQELMIFTTETTGVVLLRVMHVRVSTTGLRYVAPSRVLHVFFGVVTNSKPSTTPRPRHFDDQHQFWGRALPWYHFGSKPKFAWNVACVSKWIFEGPSEDKGEPSEWNASSFHLGSFQSYFLYVVDPIQLHFAGPK